MKKEERKFISPFSQLRSILTRRRLAYEGANLLQILIEAGLEVEAASLCLSQQARYPKDRKRTPEEKTLVDARRAAIEKAKSWIKAMLKEQPLIVSSAALIWLGQNQFRCNKDKPEWERPYWVLAHMGNGTMTQYEYSIKETEIMTRLQDCLDCAPTDTIQAMASASIIYEVIFSEPSPFNSRHRLENFFRKKLSSWEKLTIRNKDLQIIISWSNTLRIKDHTGDYSQTYSFILSILEFVTRAPVEDRNTLEAIISNWPQIVSEDEAFFSKYKNPRILNSAAKKALNDETLRNKLKIAEKIDHTTKFQYINLSSRSNIYQEIDRIYTEQQTTQRPATDPVGFSLSIAELDTLDQLCDDLRLRQQEAVSTCIDHAYNESKKGKKYITSQAANFLPPKRVRRHIKKKSLRLSPASKKKLTSLTQNLNRHNLANGKAFSASTALGLAIHLYARSLLSNEISYRGYDAP